MLLEGNSVIGDAAQREAVTLAHALYLIGSLPTRLIAPAQVLAGGLDPLKPRQRTLHLREYDG